MENYKPNSHKAKQENVAVPAERPKLEKIVKGTVQKKKRNSFVDVFVSEDIHNVKSYIIFDVLVPAVKNAIEDIVTNGIRMVLRGETGSRKSSGASKVSYREYYDSAKRDDDRFRRETKLNANRSYDEIVLESRGEAEAVLERMREIIDVYGMVRVADLYDLVGMTGDYTDNRYGWMNLRNSEVVRVRDGYSLNLPRPMPIN